MHVEVLKHQIVEWKSVSSGTELLEKKLHKHMLYLFLIALSLCELEIVIYTISKGFGAFLIIVMQAFVVEKYNRPMPKLRNTTLDSGRFEEKAVPPGTLNVNQMRYILQLHQGKAEDHNGHMDINQIAEKFRVDAAQLQKIFQFLSLPPEDINKDNMQEGD